MEMASPKTSGLFTLLSRSENFINTKSSYSLQQGTERRTPLGMALFPITRSTKSR